MEQKKVNNSSKLLAIARKHSVRYCDLLAKVEELIEAGYSDNAAVEEIINYYEEDK